MVMSKMITLNGCNGEEKIPKMTYDGQEDDHESLPQAQDSDSDEDRQPFAHAKGQTLQRAMRQLTLCVRVLDTFFRTKSMPHFPPVLSPHLLVLVYHGVFVGRHRCDIALLRLGMRRDAAQALPNA